MALAPSRSPLESGFPSPVLLDRGGRPELGSVRVFYRPELIVIDNGSDSRTLPSLTVAYDPPATQQLQRNPGDLGRKLHLEGDRRLAAQAHANGNEQPISADVARAALGLMIGSLRTLPPDLNR